MTDYDYDAELFEKRLKELFPNEPELRAGLHGLIGAAGQLKMLAVSLMGSYAYAHKTDIKDWKRWFAREIEPAHFWLMRIDSQMLDCGVAIRKSLAKDDDATRSEIEAAKELEITAMLSRQYEDYLRSSGAGNADERGGRGSESIQRSSGAGAGGDREADETVGSDPAGTTGRESSSQATATTPETVDYEGSRQRRLATRAAGLFEEKDILP